MRLADRVLSRIGLERASRAKEEKTRLERKLDRVVARLQRAQVRGFQGAANNRLVEDWFTTRSSINQLLQGDLVPLRERSRKLVRDDVYARKFVAMVCNNVVGPEGFKLELDIKDENGKIDQKAVDKIKLGWERWGKKKNCSVTKSRSYWEVSKLITETAPATGGFLVRKVRGYDNPFKFALQVIALDCLDEQVNKGFDGVSSIRMGVERDKWGCVQFYHIKTENPYDAGYSSGRSKTERVPASEIIHGFIPLEIDQARELPWFHTSMFGLQMIGGYNEAAVVAARGGANKMGFLKKLPDAAGNYNGQDADADGNRIMESAPGEIEELPAGFDFASWDPAYPHAEHGSFNKAVLRGLAAGLLVSYNSLANDLEGVNYSSLRAGLLDERDQWKVLQRWEKEVFHDDVFENWLEMAMLTGEVSLPAYKFEKFNRPCFMGRRWPWVDPLKDIEAAILAIKNHLGTRTDYIAEAGGSIEELLATLENELALMKEHGLKPPEEKDADLKAQVQAAKAPAPSE